MTIDGKRKLFKRSCKPCPEEERERKSAQALESMIKRCQMRVLKFRERDSCDYGIETII